MYVIKKAGMSWTTWRTNDVGVTTRTTDNTKSSVGVGGWSF